MRYYYIHTQEDESLVKTVMAYASHAQFTALFSNLREESKLSSTFMTLLILAT